MIKLGITGNICSGKSQIEKILQGLNIKTICADRITHDLYEDSKITLEICKILELDKIITRSEIAKIVFKDKNKLRALEELLHPKVYSKINEFFYINQNEKIVAAIVPLLYETNMEGLFEYIIALAVDEDIQLSRLMNRNSLSREDALLRINSQKSQIEKIRKSDFVLYNNSNLQDVSKELINILGKILR